MEYVRCAFHLLFKLPYHVFVRIHKRRGKTLRSRAKALNAHTEWIFVDGRLSRRRHPLRSSDKCLRYVYIQRILHVDSLYIYIRDGAILLVKYVNHAAAMQSLKRLSHIPFPFLLSLSLFYSIYL